MTDISQSQLADDKVRSIIKLLLVFNIFSSVLVVLKFIHSCNCTGRMTENFTDPAGTRCSFKELNSLNICCISR